MTFQSPLSCILDSALVKIKDRSVHQIMQSLTKDVAALTGLPAEHINHRLIQREDLVSSAIGSGVAIPHLRLRGIQKPLMILASLAVPIDFNAPDRGPVDLIMLVISPDSDGPMHLRRLARISRLMRNEGLCRALRDAKTPEQIQSLILSAGDERRAA